jgi:hypothetical protein
MKHYLMNFKRKYVIYIEFFNNINLKKVFEILSSNKYYGQFKTTPQYLKVLSEIDFTDTLNDNNSG